MREDSRSSTGEHRYKDLVGIIPAAGHANRIAPLPCSKELYPIGFRRVEGSDGVRPKTVSHYLLEKMRTAGVGRAFLVLREGKWDIPKYFGDGTMVKMDLAYLMMRLPFGPPYTIDQAYPFVRQMLVVFGFPDILFDEDDAFVKLLDRQASTGAEVVLGLFPVNEPWTTDMVEIDEHGAIRSITIKPTATNLQYAWIIAVWTPVFTEFLHEHLLGLQQGRLSANGEQSELSVGHVFQAAIQHGLTIQSVQFPDRSYLDIGTPDNLIKAVHDQQFLKEIQP